MLGPRNYVPSGNANAVQCFDYSTHASCSGYPKIYNESELGYLYTVNADPQRPTCIWVNADGGSHQIQNLDAYTGQACGQGAIRALAAQFVVSSPKCMPASYVSVQLVRPARAEYTSGALAFSDGDGNAIPGLGSPSPRRRSRATSTQSPAVSLPIMCPRGQVVG